MISLLPKRVNIIIVGGGRAALIKTRTIIEKKCKVYLLSVDFCIELIELKHKNPEQLIFIRDKYKKKYIRDKHLVIIATSSKEVNEKIKRDCNTDFKMYIDCADAKNGNAVVPCQRNTEQMEIGIHMVSSNPRASVYMADKVKENFSCYDDFLKYTSSLRAELKDCSMKGKIMEFVCSDDFYFFYKKKKHHIILRLFYSDLFS